jgi:hypothetical protein
MSFSFKMVLTNENNELLLPFACCELFYTADAGGKHRVMKNSDGAP